MWYAAFVTTGREELICDLIRTHVSVSVVEAVLPPIVCRVEITPQGPVESRQSLYPGYIFLRVKEMTGEVYQALKRFYQLGLRRVLHQCEIKDEEMLRVLSQLQAEVTVPEEMVSDKRVEESALLPEVAPALSADELLNLVKLRLERSREKRPGGMKRVTRILLLPLEKLLESGRSTDVEDLPGPRREWTSLETARLQGGTEMLVAKSLPGKALQTRHPTGVWGVADRRIQPWGVGEAYLSQGNNEQSDSIRWCRGGVEGKGGPFYG